MSEEDLNISSDEHEVVPPTVEESVVEDVSKAQYMAEAGHMEESKVAFDKQILEIIQQYYPQIKDDLELIKWDSKTPVTREEFNVIDKRVYQVYEAVKTKIESISINYPESPYAKRIQKEGLTVNDVRDLLTQEHETKRTTRGIKYGSSSADYKETEASKKYDSNPELGQSERVDDPSKAYEMAKAARESGTFRDTSADRWEKRHKIHVDLEKWTGILYDHPVSEAYKAAHPYIHFTPDGIANLEYNLRLSQRFKRELDEAKDHEEKADIASHMSSGDLPVPEDEAEVIIAEILNGQASLEDQGRTINDVNKARYMAEAVDAERSEAALYRQMVDIKSKYYWPYRHIQDKKKEYGRKPEDWDGIMAQENQLLAEAKADINSLITKYPNTHLSDSLKEAHIKLKDVADYLDPAWGNDAIHTIEGILLRPQMIAKNFDASADRSETKAANEYDIASTPDEGDKTNTES